MKRRVVVVGQGGSSLRIERLGNCGKGEREMLTSRKATLFIGDLC